VSFYSALIQEFSDGLLTQLIATLQQERQGR
jgi:hypothetical protein